MFGRSIKTYGEREDSDIGLGERAFLRFFGDPGLSGLSLRFLLAGSGEEDTLWRIVSLALSLFGVGERERLLEKDLRERRGGVREIDRDRLADGERFLIGDGEVLDLVSLPRLLASRLRDRRFCPWYLPGRRA